MQAVVVEVSANGHSPMSACLAHRFCTVQSPARHSAWQIIIETIIQNESLSAVIKQYFKNYNL
jgi:hypothetical protein